MKCETGAVLGKIPSCVPPANENDSKHKPSINGLRNINQQKSNKTFLKIYLVNVFTVQCVFSWLGTPETNKQTGNWKPDAEAVFHTVTVK